MESPNAPRKLGSLGPAWLSRKLRLFAQSIGRCFYLFENPLARRDSDDRPRAITAGATLNYQGENNWDNTPSAIDEDAQACFSEFGVWPISFSHPRSSAPDTASQRIRMFARTKPTDSYSFKSEEDYLQEYESSYYAITHKKGGWDCFRHLEILNAGCIPFMPDASSIPRYSMVHYPKDQLQKIAACGPSCNPSTNRATSEELNRHFVKHLTSQAMTKYVLERSPVPSPANGLFIDTHLRWKVDYLSVFTLLGLKQLLGVRCATFIPVPYIYSDWQGRSRRLYGRGFGYTRILGPENRDSNVRLSELRTALRSDTFDLVVFGSAKRDWQMLQKLLPDLDRERLLLFVGEDAPLPEPELERLRRCTPHSFVRSIE